MRWGLGRRRVRWEVAGKGKGREGRGGEGEGEVEVVMVVIRRRRDTSSRNFEGSTGSVVVRGR